jgi:hypothetical protein
MAGRDRSRSKGEGTSEGSTRRKGHRGNVSNGSAGKERSLSTVEGRLQASRPSERVKNGTLSHGGRCDGERVSSTNRGSNQINWIHCHIIVV